jgi:uncharacterized protein YodC (DUF2158 family)
MSDLKIGNVVWLKGGSPKMTITLIADNGNYICSWFNDKQELQTAAFEPNSLTTQDPNVPPIP